MDILERIELRGVRKRFGRQLVLAGVTTELRSGEVGLLLGPNGAGKSTLLGILSTLSRPSRGEVLYGDIPHPRAETELKGEIALVAHAPMLYRHLSGRENLRFFARIHGVQNAEEAVTAWLERVDMAHAADRPVAELSRGMTQRLTLARALLPGPRLLVLDEPFTGLDRVQGHQSIPQFVAFLVNRLDQQQLDALQGLQLLRTYDRTNDFSQLHESPVRLF